MAEQTPRRAECPACHKSVALRKDGMLWHHTGNEPEWPGSPFKAFCPRRGLPPEPDAPSKRRRRSQPDWADLREMARNAGWRGYADEPHVRIWGANGTDRLSLDWDAGSVRVFRHGIVVDLAGASDTYAHETVHLINPTPAKVLAAARLLGLGGSDV